MKVCGPKEGLWNNKEIPLEASDLSTFSTDTTGQLDVLGHDGHSLGMDGAKVGVFEQSDEVSFSGFLEGCKKPVYNNIQN